MKIKNYLASVPIENRDGIRSKIILALHENDSPLTDSFFIDHQQGTVSNWLKEYDKKVGSAFAESFSRAEFESNSKNLSKLSDRDVFVLRRFINFYEFLKMSSYDIGAFEESPAIQIDDELYLVINGKQILISNSNNKVQNKSNLSPVGKKIDSQSSYSEQSIGKVSTDFSNSDFHSQNSSKMYPQDRILEESRRVLAQTKGVSGAVFDFLEKSFLFKDCLGILGSLLLIAQIRKLDEILLDKRFYNLVADDIKKYPLSDQNLEGLRVNPRAPKYIARFLKIALEEKAGLMSEDAVGYGARISKVLEIEGEKYLEIVKERKWGV